MLPTIAEDRLLAAIYWLGAFCTLGILTILYAENRLYRLLEHFFIGLAVGYGLFIAIRDVLEPVWWRAMMTESSGVIANFDKSPNLKGVVLDRTIKREGDGAWRWSPQELPCLLLTKVPTDWGAPNYLRLWLRSDKIVPDGMLTFRIRLRNPDTQKEASLTTQLPTNFVGWREFLLDLRRDFHITGEPYRRFEKVGRYRVLSGVTALELVANPAVQQAGVVIHLDDWRHCIGYRWWWAFAFVWGLLFYTVLIPRFAWMSRMALSVLMGLGAGYTFKAFVLEAGPQIYSSIKPVFGVPFKTAVNNAIFVTVLLCVMTYFFFSIEHRHPAIRVPARLGRWLLMLTFGIVFGNTVMGRFSLFIGRLDFLILQNPLTISVAWKALLVMAIAFALFFLAYLSVRWERQKQGVT
jgi:hypothetical protein